MTTNESPASDARGLAVEDEDDALVLRRRDWMSDEQWAAIGRVLTEQGWRLEKATA